MRQGPLSGLKIVEFAGIGPGPFCGMMLADLVSHGPLQALGPRIGTQQNRLVRLTAAKGPERDDPRPTRTGAFMGLPPNGFLA